VPQMIPKIVRKVRSFCVRVSRYSCRKTSLRVANYEISFGGRWMTWSPALRPDTTSTLRPSEMPTWTSVFFGSAFSVAPGSSTNAFLPPSSNVTRRSGTVRTSSSRG